MCCSSPNCSKALVLHSGLAETDLEEMAMHETEDNKVFQRFKRKIAPEPHQVRIKTHLEIK